MALSLSPEQIDAVERITSHPIGSRLTFVTGRAGTGKSSRQETERFRCFRIGEVKQREYKLDGFNWIKHESLDDADDLGEPEELITEVVTQPTAAIDELNQVFKAS